MKLLKFVLISTVLLAAASAQALVIDFEAIDNSGSGHVFSGNSLDTQGFNLSNDCSYSSNCILHWGSSNAYNADANGVTYSHNYTGSTTTLTQSSGDFFDLFSIDFGNVYDTNSYVQEILVTGYFNTGDISSTVITDSLSGLETFTFDWTGLNSVTWTETTGTFLQLDNIVLNNAGTSVPEPSSIILLVLGLVGLNFLRKKV